MAASILDRLNDKTIKDSETGCWLWMGGNSGKKGYGRIRFEYRKMAVHRVSAILFLGFNPDILEDDTDIEVCHKCDNTNCWNPEHLYIGTRKSNAEDAVERGGYDNRANSLKTHCPHGHLLDGEVHTERNHYRYCKTCDKIRKQM